MSERVVEQLEVIIERLPNAVDRFISAVVKVGAPLLPSDVVPLDLDDERIREFLYAGAEREGFDIPVDALLVGGVWDTGQQTRIRAWLA